MLKDLNEKLFKNLVNKEKLIFIVTYMRGERERKRMWPNKMPEPNGSNLPINFNFIHLLFNE
ncbi:MAG: hypothetical protein CM15mP130_2080 [Verrucomicrobiota bacterium]|nr:MAG: hypothetical protein CM15mP130_2080 [Verrucomicrobiota bacterium]